MKIVINPKDLVVDDSFQVFHKVRAVIKNDEGKYAITTESGKCIFPGGKLENDEDVFTAIKRELLEELGIEFLDSEIKREFVLETLYDYNGYKRATYKCVCDCGNIAYVKSAEIYKRKTCGCNYIDARKDYSGQKFGKLTVLETALSVYF